MVKHPQTIAEQVQRPARKQVGEEVLYDLGALKGQMDGATSYNIWYNRWTGYKLGTNERAQYKIDPKRDLGWTVGHKNTEAYFCLFFAKGMCPRGKECKFWHRIPCPEDKEEMPVDVFGRERHGEFKADMSGVGSFSRENLTLYVGRIGSYENIEEILEREFSPFGEILKVNVLHSKSVAFVQFSRRIYAEFAKEAMSNQSLEREEVLNIRWATEDPNPGIRSDNKRRAEEQVHQALLNNLPPEFTNPILNHQEEQFETEDGEDLISSSKLISNVSQEQSLEAESTKEEAPSVEPVTHQNSLISSEVLNSLSHLNYQMKYTKSYLNSSVKDAKSGLKPSEKTSLDTKKLAAPIIGGSLLGDDYASDSDE